MAAVDVVLLPSLARPDEIVGKTVVVFDVLRATTSMIAALDAGVSSIHVFESLDAARDAARAASEPVLLCGEANCLMPPGFHLGNSPCAFGSERHRGRTLYMSTTNGTRAIHAAQHARQLLVGSLTNAAAVAIAAERFGLDITLLCAGTNGRAAMEDLLGAGAVLERLVSRGNARLDADVARMATVLWKCCKVDLVHHLRESAGGQNVMAAGLAPDIDFAARVDSSCTVGEVVPSPLRVLPLGPEIDRLA